MLAHARVALNEKVAVKGHVQWFDGTPLTSGKDVWQGVAGLALTPVPGLSILPEVRYTTKATHLVNGPQKANWTAALRFQRSF